VPETAAALPSAGADLGMSPRACVADCLWEDGAPSDASVAEPDGLREPSIQPPSSRLGPLRLGSGGSLLDADDEASADMAVRDVASSVIALASSDPSGDRTAETCEDLRGGVSTTLRGGVEAGAASFPADSAVPADVHVKDVAVAAHAISDPSGDRATESRSSLTGTVAAPALASEALGPFLALPLLEGDASEMLPCEGSGGGNADADAETDIAVRDVASSVIALAIRDPSGNRATEACDDLRGALSTALPSVLASGGAASFPFGPGDVEVKDVAVAAHAV